MYTDIENEKELLLSIAAGDESAFAAIYDKYHHALYRSVYKICQSTAETEDILQEVFVTLWEQCGGLDKSQSIGGWLFTVCFNRAVNHLKKKTRELSRAKIATERTPEIIDIHELEAQWLVMERAIEQLSAQKKKVFQLCKLEGKTYEEAAAILGISRHTVKEYLSESMKLIRGFVREHPSYKLPLLSSLIWDFFF